MQVSTALNAKIQSDVNRHGSAIVSEITQQIDRAHDLLLKCGYPTKAYTKSAVDTLFTLEYEKQLKVLENAKSLLGILSGLEPEFDIDSAREIALTKKALVGLGIHIKDQTWETKAKDRIIEVYNHQGVQLHRSLNFFKTCGYSLLDLCVNEWYVLWERPSKVVQQLNTIVEQVMSGVHRPSTDMGVRPHIIRETYDDGTTQPFLPRSIVVHFRDMFPTFNSHGEICGFIVTSEARLLHVGDEALKLGFI